MPRNTSLCASTAMALVLISHGAFADVTPADVWGDWRDYMQGMGYTMNAAESTSGDNLTVSDISIDMEMGETEGSMKISFGSLVFSQNGDGSVSVIMPENMPIAIDIKPDGTDAEPVQMQMTYSQSGHELTISGDPTNKTSEYSAATIGLVLDQLQVGNESFGEENAKVDVRATNVQSTTVMRIAALRDYKQTGSIDEISYDFVINDPDETAVAKIKGTLAGLDITGNGNIPLGLAQVTDMSAMLAAGFSTAGVLNSGPSTIQIDVQDPKEGSFVATSKTGSGELTFDMGADGVAYGAVRKDLAIEATVATLPVPLEMKMAEGSFKLAVPVTKSEEPQDFSLGMTLAGFTMSDILWSMFDPTSQLPRDPATIALDLSGKAKVMLNFLDPKVAEEMAASGARPGELEALTVNKLNVDVAGAELNGTGDFMFDNSDMTTFPGMPKPVGALDLSLVGGNGLIDKLVAMGIVPEEQAMGARMMMGLFAVAGSAPDTLNSKIEFTEEGQVLANGQRIK